MKFSSHSLIVLAVLALCAAPVQAEILTGGEPDPDWNSNAMQVWLKADTGVKDSGGENASDGETVATWEDQSNHAGRDATQGTDTKRPTFDSNNPVALNKPTVHFAGDDFLDMAYAFQDAFQGSFTIFAVVIPDDGRPTADQAWFGTRNAGEDRLYGVLEDEGYPGECYLLYRANDDASTARTDTDVFSDGTQTAATLLAFRADSTVGGVGGLKVFADGSEQTLLAAANGDTSGVTFGDYSNANNLYLGGRNYNGTADMFYSGDVAEFLIYKGALSSTDREAVEGYLMAKYIPEPSTFVLLGTALLGMLVWWWRRRRK